MSATTYYILQQPFNKCVEIFKEDLDRLYDVIDIYEEMNNDKDYNINLL